MIDVVFLLIIFFLVSSHLARQETQMTLELPAAADADELSIDQPLMTVNIDAQGNIFIGGANVNERRCIELMRQHRGEQEDAAAIRIRIDRAVRYADVQRVLSAAAAAGVSDVRFAVYETAR